MKLTMTDKLYRCLLLSTILYFLQTSHFYVWGRGGTCSKKATPLSVETRTPCTVQKPNILLQLLKKNFSNSLQTFLTKHCHYSITQSVMFQENKIPEDNEQE